MKNQPHPWNLRRISGRQFTGYVGRPSCLEAGIAARVIPAQSSRWTFHGRSNADLPTWSWMTNGIPARTFSSGHSSGVSSTFRRIIEGSASNRASTTLRLFPSPSNCPKGCFGVIARHHPPPVKPPSQWKQRGTLNLPSSSPIYSGKYSS